MVSINQKSGSDSKIGAVSFFAYSFTDEEVRK